MKRGIAVLAALASLLPWPSMACTPNYYEPSPLHMPTAMFDLEVRRILGIPEPEEYEPRSGSSYRELFKRTREADWTDLAEAVEGKSDAPELVMMYQGMTEALSRHVSQYLGRLDSYYAREQAERPAPYDLARHDALLSRLPAEFGLYLRGAAAYHAGDWDSAIAHFDSVLALPAEERAYRSTWAAFMLGKAWTQKDPAQAGPFFEQTRSLKEQNFHDPLHLAEASTGWQARAVLEAGDYRQAIHLYAQNPADACESLRIVCREALSKDSVDPELVRDDLCRQIIAAWLVSHPNRHEEAGRWLAVLETYRPEGPVPGADYLAWASYNAGHMEAASRWLAHGDPASPYGQWVQAKLLLREGKLEEGAKLLERLGASFPEGPAWKIQDPHSGYIWGPQPARPLVHEDLGEVRLGLGQYAASLYAFVEANDWKDALYVAERVLTTDELREFMEGHAQDPMLLAGTTDNYYERELGWRLRSLRSILARRYAREGQWEKAVPLYPDAAYAQNPARYSDEGPDALRAVAREAQRHFAVLNDPSSPSRTRAASLFEMGAIIRRHGPDLICPALIPQTDAYEDWIYPQEPAPDLARRVADSQESYPRMNYFIPLAANYSWRAAELLPDNDVLCAKALFTGGSYLKYRDPQAADKFYKALIRRNPNLLIAKQADEIRWFPDEFTDVVLYRPRTPDPWYGRKLYIAEALLALGAIAALAFVIRRRRRRAPAPAATT